MTAFNTLWLAALPLLAVMQGGQPRITSPAARTKTPPPAFKSIQPNILGDNWYAAYLFDVKNVSALNEKSEKGTDDGDDVYIFTDTHEINFGGRSTMTRTTAFCSTADFSLIRLTSVETGAKTSAAECEVIKSGEAQCAFSEDGGATETKVLKASAGGPIFYDGAIDRLELAMTWTPETSLDLDYLDLEKKKISRMLISVKPNTPGQPAGAITLSHTVPEKNIHLDVVAAAGKLVKFIWKDDEMEIHGYPVAGAKQAKAEKVLFASQVEPSKRTPVQAVLIMLTAMGSRDIDTLMKSFDMEKMYSHLKELYPDAAGMPFDSWKNGFTELMSKEADDLMPDDVGEPEEMARVLEAMGVSVFDVKQTGNEATVIFKPGGTPSITVQMYRAKDGRWLIYWVDAARNRGGEND